MIDSRDAVHFNEVDKEDTAVVGGKGANLGEMAKAGFPVPGGFVVTAHAYRKFLKANNLVPKIHTILDDLDVSDPVALNEAANKVQHLISSSPMPEETSGDIMKYYAELGKELKAGHGKIRSP